MDLVCPNCRSELNRKNPSFCSYCGNDLGENHCSNRECSVFQSSEVLDSDELYCYHCGSKTTYFDEGKITDFHY